MSSVAPDSPRRTLPVRAPLIVAGLLALAAAFLFLALSRNLVFFHSPGEIEALVSAGAAPDESFRLGGRIAPDSVSRDDQGVWHFTVRDLEQEDAAVAPVAPAALEVLYDGLLPPLFAEGEEVIADGSLRADGRFAAVRLFSRHDENYRPLGGQDGEADYP